MSRPIAKPNPFLQQIVLTGASGKRKENILSQIELINKKLDYLHEEIRELKKGDNDE